MKQLVRFIGVVCTLLISSLVQAEPIKVGLHDSAPWAYRNALGEITGLDYEIVKAVLQQQGIEATFELYSYSRLLKLFSEKKTGHGQPGCSALPWCIL